MQFHVLVDKIDLNGATQETEQRNEYRKTALSLEPWERDKKCIYAHGCLVLRFHFPQLIPDYAQRVVAVNDFAREQSLLPDLVGSDDGARHMLDNLHKQKHKQI